MVGAPKFGISAESVFSCGVQVSIEDSENNRRRCELALTEMDAEWGKSDSDWGYVRNKAPGWLSQQQVYCMLTKFGPLDIFRSVKGVDSFGEAKQRVIRYDRR